MEGYERLEEIKKPVQDSTKVFVAMWFDPSMDEVWNKGINPAITKARYEPIRIDQKEHTNKIDDEIIAEIRRARFVVADFTHGEGGARGGVYYEAGFAHGLGIDVIFTCREDQIDDLHFDTRQFNHITWNTPEELKKKLTQRISAVFGDAPQKIVVANRELENTNCYPTKNIFADVQIFKSWVGNAWLNLCRSASDKSTPDSCNSFI